MAARYFGRGKEKHRPVPEARVPLFCGNVEAVRAVLRGYPHRRSPTDSLLRDSAGGWGRWTASSSRSIRHRCVAGGAAMKILVTGARLDFRAKPSRMRSAGSWLRTICAACCATHRSPVGLEAIAARYPQARLEFVTANLRNPNEIPRAVSGADIVTHAAAALKGSPAEMFLDSGGRLYATRWRRSPTSCAIFAWCWSAHSVRWELLSLPRGAMVDEKTPA